MGENIDIVLALIAVLVLGIVGIWANWIRPNPSLYLNKDDQSRKKWKDRL